MTFNTKEEHEFSPMFMNTPESAVRMTSIIFNTKEVYELSLMFMITVQGAVL